MRNTLNILLLLLALWLSVAGRALAAPPRQEPPSPPLSTPQLIEAALQRGEIDRDTAYLYLTYALAEPQKLPARFHGTVPWDGTPYVLQLQRALRTMQPTPSRDAIARMLGGTCLSSTGNLPNNLTTAHFYIEYASIGGGLTITDYANSLETVWQTEVDTFGWAAPPLLVPGNLYHVRVDSLSNGLYGYVAPSGTYAGFVGDNPNTPWNEGDAYASCMVLNRDYGYSGFPSPPQASLDATTAHEFNHSIQYGLGALNGSNAPDQSFIEGGATWMEDEVFDAANDNYNYLWPRFGTCMGQYTPSPYPYWITFRGMTERYGTGIAGGGEQIMQDFWEAISQNAASQLVALNDALLSKGTTLADAYHNYAIAVKFNKPCGGGYTYPYCLEEGSGYVSVAGATSVQGSIPAIGGNYTGSVRNNYALNWIGLPTGNTPYDVILTNTASGGDLRASVVCDTGTSLDVTPFPATAGPGEVVSLPDVNPAGCNALVAVITNQEQTGANPSFCSAHSYRLEATNLKTWTGAQSDDWHDAANWSPPGVPDAANSVVIPPTARNPRLTAPGAVNNLTIQPAAGLDIATHALTIEAGITNEGLLTQTQVLTAVAPASFLHLTDASGVFTRYYGLTLTPVLTGTGSLNAPLTVTAAISGNQHCPAYPAGVARCYRLAVTPTVQANVRFYFSDGELGAYLPNDLVVLHREGTSWVAEAGPYLRGGSGEARYIEAQNVRRFSTFAVAPVPAPILSAPTHPITATFTAKEAATRTLSISNTGTVTLTWALSEQPAVPWLSESPTGGSLPPRQSASFTLTMDAAGLGAGVYTTTLHITGNIPAGEWRTLPVTLTVQSRFYLPLVLKGG